MSDLTKETVAAAVFADTWRINLHEATVTEASLHHTRGMKRESSPVVYAVHITTLVELCRQQHEALQSFRGLVVIENYADPRVIEALGKASGVLALWPDDPTEDI